MVYGPGVHQDGGTSWNEVPVVGIIFAGSMWDARWEARTPAENLVKVSWIKFLPFYAQSKF